MKFTLLFLILIAATALAEEPADTDKNTTVNPWLANEIKQLFPYAVPIPAKHTIVPALPISGELVVLPSFKVEEYWSEKLERAMKEVQDRQRRGAFSWKNGGTILKVVGKKVTTEMKFKVNEHGTFDILNFSW